MCPRGLTENSFYNFVIIVLTLSFRREGFLCKVISHGDISYIYIDIFIVGIKYTSCRIFLKIGSVTGSLFAIRIKQLGVLNF